MLFYLGENNKMSKDKIYGYGIFFITLLLMFLFTLYTVVQFYFTKIYNTSPMVDLTDLVNLLNPLGVTVMDALLWPVFIATLMVMFIIAWIGITMATTPPPEPIDLNDLNLDDDLDDDDDDKDD